MTIFIVITSEQRSIATNEIMNQIILVGLLISPDRAFIHLNDYLQKKKKK